MLITYILLARNNMEIIKTTEQWLSSAFKMKDMGETIHVLGVEITWNYSKKLLGLSQEAYINKILAHFRMHHSKPADTPIKQGLTLSLGQCPKTDNGKRENEQCPLCKCSRKVNVYHFEYTVRYLLCSWFDKSLPK